jgi:hypothetical protein
MSIQASEKELGPLRPRLISIGDAHRYTGVCRAKFYLDVLPHLKTVRIGRRNLIDLESLDRLIDDLATR